MRSSVAAALTLPAPSGSKGQVPLSAPLGRRQSDGPSTTWSIILRAQGSGKEAREALGRLIARYERPVTCMFRAQRIPPGSSPEDLKQEFFSRFVGNGHVHKLQPERGKFRSWLHVAVRNFLRNVWAHYHVRASRSEHMYLDHESPSDPERLFMRRFAEATVRCTLERLRAQARDKERFDRWLRFLPGPQLDLCALAGEAEALGMSRNHVAVQLHHLRERFRRVLREVIADTLDDDPSSPDGARAIDAELAELYQFLSGAAPTEVVTVEP